MTIDRRKFLKLAGAAAALGIAGKPVYNILAAEEATSGKNSTERIRYAMVVNLGLCQEHPDCRVCIDSCHKAHNVPNFGANNKKDEVKWIWKEEFKHAFVEQGNNFLPQNLNKKQALLFCNHCDNPPCVNVCPTKSTWKREDGIVMMDWHRCIGCRYCMAACPYGSRSFNWKEPRTVLDVNSLNTEFPTRTLGVVEKCTFCDERLARGQMPACVEACPFGAMTFGNLNDPKSKIREILGKTYSIRRKPELGTKPEIYYIV